MTPVAASTPDGLLLVLAVLVPFAGLLAGFVLGGRNAQRVAFATVVAGLLVAFAIVRAFVAAGAPLVYVLGGFAPPLGVALRADGLAVAMIGVVAVVVAGIAVYGRADFGAPGDAPESRASFSFWLLLLAVWGSLALVFVAGDLFTLYVALELLTFAGVPLVCLDGRGETLRAALRYLLYALFGSVLYLLGAVLLYGAYGTLDVRLLAAAARPDAPTLLAAAFAMTGLLAKTALFPLHLWLPPAHAGAPAAASAILSALVIKGSWFLALRLVFDALPHVTTGAAMQCVSALGATAIVVASLVALRQERLKLVVAYSTLAQIGYLFLVFAVAFAVDGPQREAALAGGVLQAAAHATAKAAMFMAAGLVYKACGHDRIAGIAGVARVAPLAVIAFALGGVALMGVLPSGAYLAKKLLQDAAGASGQPWWDAVLVAGGFLTTSYVVLVVASALGRPPAEMAARARVPRSQGIAAVGLALCSFALALAAVVGPLPSALVAAPFAPKELAWTLVTLAGGCAIAFSVAPHVPAWPRAVRSAVRPLRPAMTAASAALVHADAALRRWPSASLSLLVVAIALVAALRLA